MNKRTLLILSIFQFFVLVSYAQSPTTTENYILETAVKSKGHKTVSSLNGLPVDSANRTIRYLDGLGRPVQTIQWQGSPSKKDVVQPVEYDVLGLESKKYLPYAEQAAGDAAYKSAAVANQSVYYGTGSWDPEVVKTPNPYSISVFEVSPLKRILEQGAPGASWQPVTNSTVGHTVKSDYSSNTAADSVLLWRTNSNGASAAGFYSANHLYKTIVKDENWVSGKIGTIEEFKDLEGHMILKKIWQSETSALSTYYIYDDYGNLAYVVPPAVSATGFTESDSVFSQLTYGYHYDDRNRVTEKKIPGKGWEFMVYNQLDQLVMSQDANQRNKTPQQWFFTKYDAIGRVALTGIYQYPGSAADGNISAPDRSRKDSLQTLSNGWATLWESRNDNDAATGYTNVAMPGSGISNYLVINYYDDYTFPGGNTFSAMGASTHIKGLQTGIKINTIGTANMLLSFTFYDEEGRVIQTDSQNHLGGTDNTTNSYTFGGELTGSTRTHVYNNTTTSIVNDFVYDHAGRELKSYEQINTNSTAGARVLLHQLVYNETGQLSNKLLHSVTDGQQGTANITLGSADVVKSGEHRTVTAATEILMNPGFEAEAGSFFDASITGDAFVQTIHYAYNERGWLKQINDPSSVSALNTFGMKLVYDDHTDAAKRQFNGNISSAIWQSKVPVGLNFGQAQQSYDYTYDKLNRLNLADYTTTGKAGYFNESISYDVMGNIRSLERKGNGALIDQLSYAYQNSNQSNVLASVTDNSGNNEGQINGATVYTYDLNGNLLTDDKKALTIQYNVLDLPNLVTKTTTNETIAYLYDAAGRKLRKVLTGNNRDYVNGIEYDNSGQIEFIQTAEGRAVKSGTAYSYEYMLKDHLGNTRVVVKQDGTVLQVPDYYAFGMEMNHNQVTPSPDNRYKYNGKELQTELGMNQYDYGARFYDPVIGRWNVVDPLAEMDRKTNPYAYVFNNPMRFIDPDGMLGEPVQSYIAGTYYNEQGKPVGDDKIPDGKIYSTTDAIIKENTKDGKTDWKGVRENKETIDTKASIEAPLSNKTDEFNKQIHKTSTYFADARRMFNNQKQAILNPLIGIKALMFFFISVTDRSPFDIKNIAGGPFSQTNDKNEWSFYGKGKNAILMHVDDYGNYNYGVAAAAFGYPLEVAKFGAGLNQISKTFKTTPWGVNVYPTNIEGYFDQPRDTKSIIRGYYLK